MSSNNSVRAIIGLAVVTLIGCVQFEGSFGEPRGPETSRTVNSSSTQDLTKSYYPFRSSNDRSDDGSVAELQIGLRPIARGAISSKG
jgi:hypothetical protein